MNIDSAELLHIGNHPSRNMHSLIDDCCAYDVHCAPLNSYQMFHACLLRDHVHYTSMNMRNLRTFLSTDLLDLQNNRITNV